MGSGQGEAHRTPCEPRKGMRRKGRIGWWILDITKFFDHVNHDILMGRIASSDPGQTGVAADREISAAGSDGGRGGGQASVEGTPQGGPLSPLLANIYLDALDQELERREHRFCRYADDCNIYVGSQAAAERTLASVQGWIEKHLRLKVNATKSGTGRIWERKFLGFRLNRERQIEVAPESLERFKTKVREIVAELPEPNAVTNCGTTGDSTCAAGGGTTDWPRTADRFSGWRAGFAGISGNASGCGGTSR